ncbi:hypothetical protein J6590_101563, partial [Homalodisca vitripennis]
CNNPMEIDLVILVAKGEALHDQSSVQEIDDLSKQKRHVKSGEKGNNESSRRDVQTGLWMDVICGYGLMPR